MKRWKVCVEMLRRTGRCLLVLLLGGAAGTGSATADCEESGERFRTAFNGALIGIALIALDGQWICVNRALCELFGYDEAALLQRGPLSLTHPEDASRDREQVGRLVAGRIRSYTAERRYLHREGHLVWAQLSVSLVRDENGAARHLIAQLQNISERKQFEAELLNMVNLDPLTDLPNRRRFQAELEGFLQEPDPRGAVLFLDLDGFKYVNDCLGHSAGDLLLRQLGDLLREKVGDRGTTARMGGDEFAVLLRNCTAEEAEAVAGHLRSSIRYHSVMIDGNPVALTVSIGVALVPAHGTTAQELMPRADVAMYLAKETGRDGVSVYTLDEEGRSLMEAKLTWERQIRRALDAERFVLHGQPIMDLETGRVSHYELLLRMIGEDGEVIPPGAFLDVAERFGLIHEIDRWTVRRAIHLLADIRHQAADLSLAVNLSGKAFSDRELLPLIQRELAATGITPSRLVLEITETRAIADTGKALQFIQTLQGLGCCFAIDDFGAGFSSFGHLRNLPVEYLKIDGSFVRNLPADPVNQHLVKAMVEMARGMGKRTVAEFVGDDETVRLLREYGVNYAQGFHIGLPASFGVHELQAAAASLLL